MTNPNPSLEAAIAALGRKRQGYADALDAATEELALLDLTIEAADDGDEKLVRNLQKHRAYLVAEARNLEESLSDTEAHLKFMIGQWNDRQGNTWGGPSTNRAHARSVRYRPRPER